jgi:hypothetical protein
MSRKWLITLLLTAAVWWVLSIAAAAKIEHFQDPQGTLHITNVEPEDQAKSESKPASASSVSQGGRQAQPPQAPAPAPSPPPSIAGPPDEGQVQTESNQTPGEASPQVEGIQEPGEQSSHGAPEIKVDLPVSHLREIFGSPADRPGG